MTRQNTNEYYLRLPLHYNAYHVEDDVDPNYISENTKGFHTIAFYDGHQSKITRISAQKACETITLPTHCVALVLVDFWGTGTEKDLLYVDELQRNIGELLRMCREHGVTIIHAPNKPGIDSYPQYHQLRARVREAMQEYPRQKNPEFMAWPPYDNPLSRHMREVRARGWPDNLPRKIHYLAKPITDEYVAYTHEEFRYALWETETCFVMYAGYGLNNCILHRPTGINALAGTDSVHEETYCSFYRVPISIGIVKDCTLAGAIPGHSPEEARTSILEYLKVRLAYEIDSKAITFSSAIGRDTGKYLNDRKDPNEYI